MSENTITSPYKTTTKTIIDENNNNNASMVDYLIFGTGAVSIMFGMILHQNGKTIKFLGRDSKHSNERAEHWKKNGLIAQQTNSTDIVNFPAKISADTMKSLLLANEDESIPLIQNCKAIIVGVKRAGNEWVSKLLNKANPSNDLPIIMVQNGTNQSQELLNYCKQDDEKVHDISWNGTSIYNCMLAVAVNLREDNNCYISSDANVNLLALAKQSNPIVEELCKTLSEAKFKTVMIDDIASSQRSKIILNCGNAVSALFGYRMLDMWNDSNCRKLLNLSMSEGKQVFEKLNFTIDPKVNLMLKISNLPSFILCLLMPILASKGGGREFVMSMNKDLVTEGKKTEVRELNGQIVQEGLENNIPTPVNSAIVNVIEEMESGKRPRRALNKEEVKELFPFL